MIPDTCTFCKKGKLKEGTTEFIAHVKNQVIVVEDVPGWICQQCGEAYYSLETSKKIDIVLDQIKNDKFMAKPIAAGKISLSAISG